MWAEIMFECLLEWILIERWTVFYKFSFHRFQKQWRGGSLHEVGGCIPGSFNLRKIISIDWIQIITKHPLLVFQVLAYVLKIPTNPHNGTWSHVRGLLLGEPGSAPSSQAGAVLLTIAVAASIALGLRH